MRLLPSPLAAKLPLLAGCFQFLIAPGPDRLGATFQLSERRHIADRAVQANPIVMVDVAGQQAPSLAGGAIKRIGGDGSNSAGALILKGSNAFVEVGSQNGNSALTTLSTIASNGTLDLEDRAVLTANAGVNLRNSGQISVGSSSSIPGSTLTVGGDLSNAGDVSIGNGGRLTVLGGAYLQTRGTTNMGGELITAVAVITGGTLEGTGTINAIVVQTGGSLQPGDAPGTLTINGDYGLLHTTFIEEIGGGAVGADYGVLDVRGAIGLFGGDTLSLRDLSNFTPTDGEVLDIINADSIFSTFSNDDIAFADGFFTVDYENSGCNFGSACVDLVWNDAPPALAAEPSSFLLLGIALLALCWKLRRRSADVRA